MRRVDFDSASTTNVQAQVLKTYIDLLQKEYANSESLYDEGVAMHLKLEKARAAIASLLQVRPELQNPIVPPSKGFVLPKEIKNTF